ncbi:hypothetical protein [Microcoleus sp. S13_C5]|uniref:hypothetical protein n=1 Tax=Microcoleus sp. S13_C5 TaxID=3055411 RepID=UPI002FCFFEF2
MQVSIPLKNKFARTRSHRWYGIADVEGYSDEADWVKRSPRGGAIDRLGFKN